MTDEELVKRLRSWAKDIQAGSTAIYAMDLDLKNAATSIEALTAERDEALNQLDSARHSVDVLEKRVAFVEGERRKTFQALLKVTKIHDEVGAKLATCEKYRDAYAECDRIGTQAVRDLEVGLAKTQDVIAWDRLLDLLPGWIEWVVRDVHGAVFGYGKEPNLCGAGSSIVRIDDFPGIVVQIGTADWKESKMRRPRNAE
jgi:hypothetical protein